MLNDEIIDKLVDRIVERINNANEKIIKQIGESINKIGALSPSKANQLVQILKYGGDYNKIVKELSKITKLNIKEIDQIFEEVAKSDYKFAKQFYDYKKKKYIPYKENYALQTQVEAVKRATESEYMNLSLTSMLGYGIQDEKGNIVFKTIKEVYYNVLDEAVLSVGQGKETFYKNLKNTLESIGESGLRVIYPTTYETKDKDGNIIVKHHSRRLDTAIKMNINDGINQLHNKTQEILGEQFGADGVEISAHINPAPDHEDLQGRQFSYEEYNKLNTKGTARAYDGTIIKANKYRRPVSTLNCRHYEFSIILGVSKQRYSDKELKKIKEDNHKGFVYEGKHYTNYEGTQLQRKLELKIRQENDKIILAEKTGQDDLVQIYKNNIKTYRKKRKQLQELIFGGK